MMLQISNGKLEAQRPPGSKHTLVTLTCTCPLCKKQWRFQWREWITKPEEQIKGIFRQLIGEKWWWRIDSSKWGRHSLCGKCLLKSKVMVTVSPPGQSRKTKLAWTEKDEQLMWGHLKHQQNEFAGWVSFKAVQDEHEPLEDQQAEEATELFGKGKIIMSEEKMKSLELNWVI